MASFSTFTVSSATAPSFKGFTSNPALPLPSLPPRAAMTTTTMKAASLRSSADSGYYLFNNFFGKRAMDVEFHGQHYELPRGRASMATKATSPRSTDSGYYIFMHGAFGKQAEDVASDVQQSELLENGAKDVESMGVDDHVDIAMGNVFAKGAN